MPKSDPTPEELESRSKIKPEPEAEKGVPARAEAEAKAEGLVTMTKGDQKLHVHPTAVKAHTEKGWKAH